MTKEVIKTELVNNQLHETFNDGSTATTLYYGNNGTNELIARKLYSNGANEFYCYDENGNLESKVVESSTDFNNSIGNGLICPVTHLRNIFYFNEGELIAQQAISTNRNINCDGYAEETQTIGRKIFKRDEDGTLHSIDNNFIEEWYDDDMNIIKHVDNWDPDQFTKYPINKLRKSSSSNNGGYY